MRIVTFEDCTVFIRNGVSVKQDKKLGGIPITRIETISNQTIDKSKLGYAGITKISDYEQYILLGGDILISHINSMEHLGKTGLYLGTPKVLIHGMNLLCIRPDKSLVTPKYMYYFTKSDTFKLQLPKISNQSVNQSSFSMSKFKTSINIPLPSLEHQKRIVKILDQADALRQKRKEAIRLLDEYVKSVFLEMFGDLVLNSKGWVEISLTNLCKEKNDIRCGPFGTQLLKSEFKKEGVPLWGIKQVNKKFSFPTKEFVTNKKAEELSNYDILPGDIIMTRKGTIGNCCVYPKHFPNGVMHSDLLRIRINIYKVNPIFLEYQLMLSQDVQSQIETMSPGAIMAGINVGKLKELRVKVPPLDLQSHFHFVVEKINTLKRKMLEQSQELEIQFQALMQKAFKGEL